MRKTFSAFTPYRPIQVGRPNARVFARVTVAEVTGWLWWRRTVSYQEIIYREPGATYWRFLSSGEFTPSNVVENLESAYNAQQEKANAAHPLA